MGTQDKSKGTQDAIAPDAITAFFDATPTRPIGNGSRNSDATQGTPIVTMAHNRAVALRDMLAADADKVRGKMAERLTRVAVINGQTTQDAIVAILAADGDRVTACGRCR